MGLQVWLTTYGREERTQKQKKNFEISVSHSNFLVLKDTVMKCHQLGGIET